MLWLPMTRHLRVLNVLPAVYPARGGSMEAAVGMCAAVLRRGVQAEIVTTNAGAAGSWMPFADTSLMSVPLGTLTEWRGVRTHFFQVAWPSRFSAARGLRAWLASSLDKYDVVHIHGLYRYPGLVASRIARRKGIPYVISPHGELAPYHRRRRRIRKAIFYRLIEEGSLRNAAAIQYASHRERDQARSLGLTGRDFVVPLGVDDVRPDTEPSRGQFRSRYPETQNKVLITFLGRIAHQKGLDILIPAFAQAVAGNPSTHLVVAGPSEDRYADAVKRLAVELGVSSQITYTGYVGGIAKRELLVDTDLWILPSRDENFGLAVAEAMIHGLPVIISNNVPMHQEIERARAGLVTDASIASLVPAISALVYNPEMRKTMGAAAREFAVRNLSWDKVAQTMIGHYQSVINVPAELDDPRN